MTNKKISELIDERRSMNLDKEISEALSSISEIDKIEVDEAFSIVHNHIRKNKPFYRFLNQVQKIAAILFIPLLIGSLYYVNSNKNIEKPLLSMVYYTKSPIGMRSMLTLPDSSIVWLNSGSTISYSIPFTQSNRKVNLNGEAYFEVSKIHGSAFYVKSSSLEVKVLGTKFNFKAYNDEKKTEVVLDEGKVVLLPLSALNGDMVTMKPGTRAIVDNSNGNVVTNSENTEKFTAWRKGMMIFDNTPFVEVAKQLERWYGTEIIVKDPAIYKYKITTKFKDETLKDVLEMLEISSPIKITYKANILDPKTNQIKVKSKIIIKKR